MSFLMDVAGILSIDKGLATTIVNAVDLMGWVFVGASVILAIVSAGTLAAASLSVDALIFTIKDFLKRNLKAQAIAW